MASFLKYLLLMLIFSSEVSFSKDFGVVSNSFRIIEEDLSDHLMKKASLLQEPEIRSFNNILKEGYRRAFEEPSPIELPESKRKRVFFFDPTVCAHKDIYDLEGSLIVKEGDCINPLKGNKYNVDILFFDGANEDHINWAKDQNPNAKWVLVKGNPVKLGEKENRAVFFDQGGALTKKLKILSIPANIERDGDLIKISETPISKGVNHA
jgi:conjugal transfer pilus assembly protein TraW